MSPPKSIQLMGWLLIGGLAFLLMMVGGETVVSSDPAPPPQNLCGPFNHEYCDEHEIDCKYCITTVECPDGSMGLPFSFYCAKCCFQLKTRCDDGSLEYDCETGTRPGTPACPLQPFVPCELMPDW